MNKGFCCVLKRNEEDTNVKNVLHDFLGGTTLIVAKVVKVTKVRTVERVANDLDVLLTKVLLRHIVADVRAERRVDENALVQVRHCVARAERRDCLEHAKRMAALKKFRCVALMKSPGDQQNYIVNHVPVRDKVQELGQRVR